MIGLPINETTLFIILLIILGLVIVFSSLFTQLDVLGIRYIFGSIGGS